jgi:hypothetical protein
VRVVVELDAQTLDRLRSVARVDGVTLGDVLRRAVAEHLDTRAATSSAAAGSGL